MRLTRTSGRRLTLTLALALAALGVVGACSSFEAGESGGEPLSEAGADGTMSPDGDVANDGGDAAKDGDASSRCDARTPFEPGVLVPGLAVGGKDDIAAYLSPDELHIVFSSDRSGIYYRLFEGSRADRSTPFSVRPLAGFGGAQSEVALTFLPGTPTMFFCVQTALTRRIATVDIVDGAAVGSATNVALNVGVQQCHPQYARFAPEMWFSVYVGSRFHLYRAQAVDGGFGTPTAVSELNTTYDDYIPVLSDDGLAVYWSSDRNDDMPVGGHDIRVATRTSTDASFTDPRDVHELNSTGEEWPVWLSPDQCRLYYASGNPATLKVATRSPAP